MGIEPFNVRETNEMIFHLAQLLFRTMHDVANLRIVMDGQGGEESGCAACRQDVIRAGHVIRERRRGVPPKEERSSVPDLFQIIEGLIHCKRHVLCRNLVGQIDRLIHRCDDKGHRVTRDRLRRNFFALQSFQLITNQLGHIFRQLMGRRD